VAVRLTTEEAKALAASKGDLGADGIERAPAGTFVVMGDPDRHVAANANERRTRLNYRLRQAFIVGAAAERNQHRPALLVINVCWSPSTDTDPSESRPRPG
jgi:hypothetical protein